MLQGLKMIFPAHAAIIDALSMATGALAVVVAEKGGSR